MDSVDPVVLIETYRQVAELSQRVSDLSQKLDASNSIWRQWLPAGAAVISAIATVAVGYLSRKTVLKQIEVSKEATEKQIAASKEIALAQLDASKEQIVRQLRANVVAISRRQWTEQLREKIARYISLSNSIHSTLLGGEKISTVLRDEHWEVKTHIQLMMNENEPEHALFLMAMQSFNNVCWSQKPVRDSEKIPEVVTEWNGALSVFKNDARKILKAAWEKVKTLE